MIVNCWMRREIADCVKKIFFLLRALAIFRR